MTGAILCSTWRFWCLRWALVLNPLPIIRPFIPALSARHQFDLPSGWGMARRLGRPAGTWMDRQHSPDYH